MMSWWTFSDVFEENGPRTEPFDGGFGLIASGSIRKPSFNAFKLLHTLGTERLDNPGDLLVTRRKDGTLVIAIWNLVEMDKLKNGRRTTVVMEFKGVKPNAVVSIRRLDALHGNTQAAYESMGSPRYPTLAQIKELNEASKIGRPDLIVLREGKVELDLPADGLAILEIAK